MSSSIRKSSNRNPPTDPSDRPRRRRARTQVDFAPARLPLAQVHQRALYVDTK